MRPRRCHWLAWLLLSILLSIATPTAEAWGQTPPPSVRLSRGAPAPYAGLLLTRERAAVILTMAADLEQTELDLLACQARAISGPMEVAESTPPCPELPPERSPWPDRALGAVGGSVGTAVVILVLILLTPG